MRNIKSILILALALVIVTGGAFSVFAKEDVRKDKNEDKKIEKVEKKEEKKEDKKGDDDRDEDNDSKVRQQRQERERINMAALLDAVLPVISTTTQFVSTTTPTSTSTTTPGAPAGGGPVTSTSTPSAGTTTPPVATTTKPVATTTPVKATTTPATTATSSKATTTPFFGIAGQVNNILGENFLTSNYYGGSGFSAGLSRVLKFVAAGSAIAGLGLLGSQFYPRRRLYS